MPVSKKRGGANKPKAPPAETNGHDNEGIFNFKMSAAQHQAGSNKSGKGRVFNLSLYFKLLHREFVDTPLEESQARMARLIEKYGSKVGLEGQT